MVLILFADAFPFIINRLDSIQYTTDDSSDILNTQIITTKILGKAIIVNEDYENSDGTPLKIDTDYFGNKRSESNPSAGPFENPEKGSILSLKVW